MSETAAALRSGKGHTDENFPVASVLIHPRHRGPVMAFYRFARTADDVADHETASADEKLHLLDGMEESLVRHSLASPEAARLKVVLAEHGLSAQHAIDLLEAFRRDVTKLRYADWDDLMDYCRYSAMPVGRFVLDVHGEDCGLWPRSDALCAALQVINHLQDCAKDFRALNRVYLPLDQLERAGIGVEALQEPHAGAPLAGVIRDLAARTSRLLEQAKPFAEEVADVRLGIEVAVIQRLAEDLTATLLERDPLSERVHHRKTQAIGLAFGATARFMAMRLTRRRPQTVSGP